MGHDIYANRVMHPLEQSQYHRQNMSGDTLPLYRALNAEDCHGGVSGLQEERRYDQAQLIEAITSLRKQWFGTTYFDPSSEYAATGPIAFCLSDDNTEQVNTETLWQYAMHADFLARCLELLIEYPDDTIEIYFG
jgi:hypothetical protein